MNSLPNLNYTFTAPKIEFLNELFHLIENKIKILDLCPMNYGKTDLCKHEKSCTHNILKGFIKGFIKTYAFNTCLRLIKIIFQFSKQRKDLLKNLL